MFFPFGYIELADISIASRTRLPKFAKILLVRSLFLSPRTLFDIRMNHRRFFATHINDKNSFIYFQHAFFQRTVVFVATINIQQWREIEYLRLQEQAVCDAHTATALRRGGRGARERHANYAVFMWFIRNSCHRSTHTVHRHRLPGLAATHRSSHRIAQFALAKHETDWFII